MEGILRTLRFTSLVFASKKKSTDSKPYGLPSVALAKDGGGRVICQRTLLLKIFYAQMIKKFAEAIPYFIESYKTAKKVP